MVVVPWCREHPPALAWPTASGMTHPRIYPRSSRVGLCLGVGLGIPYHSHREGSARGYH